MQEVIDFERLEIRPLEPNEDIPQLDCTEDDGSDPLEVQNFLQSHARHYHVGRVSTLYMVKKGERVLVFFTLSMTSLRTSRIASGDRLTNFRPITYPAVLLGQMGADKRYRRQGLGQLISHYCVGLAQSISEQIACRYIALETNQDRVRYYSERCGFRQSVQENSNGRIWMYRRVTPQEIVVNVNETVGITESVVAVIRHVEENNISNNDNNERHEQE